MPGRDGTGPLGQGPRMGRGRGLGMGRGRGARNGAGPAGQCICVVCGMSVVHQAGVPCASMVCPKCGAKMVRG